MSSRTRATTFSVEVDRPELAADPDRHDDGDDEPSEAENEERETRDAHGIGKHVQDESEGQDRHDDGRHDDGRASQITQEQPHDDHADRRSREDRHERQDDLTRLDLGEVLGVRDG